MLTLTAMLVLTTAACGNNNGNKTSNEAAGNNKTANTSTDTTTNAPKNDSNTGNAASSDDAGNAAEPAKDPVKIVVWDWLNGDQNTGPGKFFKEIDAAFMAKYPNVTVEHVPEPSDTYYDLLQTAFSANQAPDVFLMHAGQYDKKQKSLLKLNGLVDDIQPDLLGWEVQSEGGDPNNAMYGVPMGIQGVVWYYNKDLFTKAGLDPNSPPKTWDELLAASEKLKTAGITPIFGGNKEGAYFNAWLYQNMLSNVMTEADMKAFGDPKVDYSKNPIIKKTFEEMKELIDKGYYPKEGLSTPIYPDGGEKFIKGEAAMTLGLIADVLNWKEFGDKLGYDKVGMFPNPAPEGSAFPGIVNAAPGVAWSVYAQSKHQEEALNYAKFVTSAENELKLYQYAGTIPNNKQVDLSVLDKDIIKQIADSVFKTPILPFNQYRSLMKADVSAPLQAYIMGGATIDQTMKKIQKNYEKDQALKK